MALQDGGWCCNNAPVTRDVPATQVQQSSDPLDCRMVAHDVWPRRLLERREELPVVLPQRVFWPGDDDEVRAVVLAARRERRPLVPFGAGSGVCGGVSPTSSAWVVDLKRMSRVLDIDVERRTVTVEAGVIGERLEQTLNARGLTLGHFPSSIYCSTVGGWVATRSAGQLSSRYGKIEDMVLSVSGIDGRGERITAALHDDATGPAAVQLLVGSEGALAILTRFVLRVHPVATHRWLRGFSFDDLGGALACVRALLQSGEAPTVLRVYDGADSALGGGNTVDGKHEPDRVVAGGISRAGNENSGPDAHSIPGAGNAPMTSPAGERDEPTLFDQLAKRVDDLALFSRPRAARRIVGEILASPTLANSVLDRLPQRPRMVVGLEGSADELLTRGPQLKKRLIAMGAVDTGDAPGARWLSHRHRVSYRMSRAFAAGSWVDTCEVATGYASVVPLYRDVKEALRDVAVVMCHFSHAYPDGCSLYFTFAGGGVSGSGPRSALSRYDLAWERVLAVVRRYEKAGQPGACLSHHHGVGRSKARGQKLDGGKLALLSSWKTALDPDGILNPGVLGLFGAQAVGA